MWRGSWCVCGVPGVKTVWEKRGRSRQSASELARELAFSLEELRHRLAWTVHYRSINRGGSNLKSSQAKALNARLADVIVVTVFDELFIPGAGCSIYTFRYDARRNVNSPTTSHPTDTARLLLQQQPTLAPTCLHSQVASPYCRVALL